MATLIDDEVRAFIRQHPDAVVAQIGAGIDARFERLGRPAITAWVDMDLPEVIALRRGVLALDSDLAGLEHKLLRLRDDRLRVASSAGSDADHLEGVAVVLNNLARLGAN